MSEKPREPQFEDQLKKLEEIVSEMDRDDVPLERAMALYEEGVKLRSQLTKMLGQAQQKIELLAQRENGEMEAEPFEDVEDEG